MIDPMSPSDLSRRRATAANEASGDYHERRSRIVVAAAELFGERGYERSNFAEIGRRTGLNRATIYYYFSSKEGLLHEVIRESIASNLDDITAIHAADLPPALKLRAAVKHLMMSYADNYPHQYVYVRADTRQLASTGDPTTLAILELVDLWHEHFTAIVEEGQKAGVIRRTAPTRLTAWAIIGMVNQSHRWYRPDGPMTGEELGEVLADLALNGVLEPAYQST